MASISEIPLGDLAALYEFDQRGPGPIFDQNQLMSLTRISGVLHHHKLILVVLKH